MWKSLITILCATGTVLAYNEPQSVLAQGPPPLRNRKLNGTPNRIIRRYTCPEAFVRLAKDCFYFSSGTANWQDAHFYCQDRNATLATLPKKHMDRKLRDYLLRPHLQQYERWIGARYDWGQKLWRWGVTGEEITYNGFSRLRSSSDQLYQWHCAVMNPDRKFHWGVRDCIQQKYYVCHAPAADLGCTKILSRGTRGEPRRRERVKCPVNRNGTLSRRRINRTKTSRFNEGPLRSTRKSPPIWGNGMKLETPTPSKPGTRWAPGAKYSDRLRLVKGKTPNEPDHWVSRSKGAEISEISEISENHLDSESRKEPSAEKISGIPFTRPKTLSAGTNDFMDQGEGLDHLFNTEILFKN